MKISKRMFRKRFCRQEVRYRLSQASPNQTYFLGTWKQDCYLVQTSLITDGMMILLKKHQKKEKVILYQASYAIYIVKITKKGCLYETVYVR